MVGPIVGAGDEALADGIRTDVGPFFREVFAGPDLGVPALALPEGADVRDGERAGHEGFPVFHPGVEIGDGKGAGATEEMDVVGHDDVAAHPPVSGGVPGGEEGVAGLRPGKHGLAAVGDGGHEEKDRAGIASPFEDGMARGMPPGGKGGGRRGDGRTMVHEWKLTEKGTFVQCFFGGRNGG